MPQKERQTGDIDRRGFLRVGLLVGSAAIGIPAGYLRAREIIQGEGNEDYDLVGEKLQVGEIIGDRELAQKYLEAIEGERPLEADPTIIRSTLYNAMRFYGTSERLAKRRSENVSISNDEVNRCLGACAYDSASGLGAEFNEGVFAESRGKLGWILSLLALSHEAYHLSVKKVLDRKGTEDYGVLGSYRYSREVRGFWRSDDVYNGEFADLINAPPPTLVGDNITRISLPEEFFAEFGKLRYYKYLLSSGLGKNKDASMFRDHSAFPNFIQSLVNIQDTQGHDDSISWQDWWGEALSAETIDNLHYQSDRFGLYRGIGERILFWNEKEKSPLSEEDTAALGVVAFADFVEYHLTNSEILTSLISEPITPEMIGEKAEFLSQQRQRYEEQEEFVPEPVPLPNLEDQPTALIPTQPPHNI